MSGGTPTTYTLYPVTDGHLSSASTSYATASSGSGLTLSTGFLVVGQNRAGSNRTCYESFLAFDTSGVVGTIQSATLSIYGSSDLSDTAFTIEARLHDWGATLETADWVAGTSLSSKTLLATFATTGFSTSSYSALVSESAFAANINQSGTTRLLLCSSRLTTGVDPVGAEFIFARSSSFTGTANDPKLVIEALVP